MWNSIYKHLRTISGNTEDINASAASAAQSPISALTTTHLMSMFDVENHDVAMNGHSEQNSELTIFEDFHVLPDEVLLNIFQFLRRRNIILKIELVNRRFHALAQDEYLWWSLTFEKRGRNVQTLDSSVRLFERTPERDSFVKLKLNCRDYFMEKVLVKKSCEVETNKMSPQVFSPTSLVSHHDKTTATPQSPSSPFSPNRSTNFFNTPTVNTNSPTTPSGDNSSPTTSLKRKFRNAWRPMLSMGLAGGGSSSSDNGESNTLFGHDKNFEKKMKMAQDCSTRRGHFNPHARHRHTITCTTPDESSFVMIGGFKNANNLAAPVVQNAVGGAGPPPEVEIEDTDVLHEFDTGRAHFSQVRIRTPTSPLTPNTIANQFSFPVSPLTPHTNAALFNASVQSPWMNVGNGNNNGETTPTTPLSATSSRGSHGNHTRTNSLSGKPMQFGKHSCVCVDNRELLLFGGTEGENTTVTNNLYSYDLKTKEWTHIEFDADTVQPSARTNHQAALVTGPNGRKEMYIVGGGIGQQMTPTNEVWALDVRDYTWRQVELKTKPDQKTCPFTPRLGFTMHEINNKLVVYGGGYWYQNGTEKKWKEYYRESFVFDVRTSVWTNIDMTNCIDHVPRSGTFPVSCRVGTHLFVVGGGIVWDVSSEVNVLDLVTLKWRKLNSEQSYAADSSACITMKDYSENPMCPKTKILLFGGYRYKPLSEYKVFAVRWKDYMTERGRDSLSVLKELQGPITTSS